MSAAWLVFTHHSGAFLDNGLITVIMALFIVCTLQNERADGCYNAA